MEGLDHAVTSAMDNKVKILAPTGNGLKISDFMSIPTSSSLQPFSSNRQNTLNLLSRSILQDTTLRRDAASVALAYWLRRANMEKIHERFKAQQEREQEIVFVPAGRIFHIAPANVDTLFVYSWALSFLCGNTNIIRLSRQQSTTVVRLIKIIGDIMNKDSDLGNRFITYGHDREVTETISRWCNHRVIWGGNETADAIRPLYLNPHASERIFASKFSYAVISAVRFWEADKEERKKVAANFFNDMFWFDQMACSSPHIVFWVGSKEKVGTVLPVFNELLRNEVQHRNHKTTASNALRRLNLTFDLAALRNIEADISYPGFVSIKIPSSQDLDKEICGGGILKHVQIDGLSRLIDFADENDQTITHFGFTDTELRQLAKQVGAKGVDRLVPIGEALSFSSCWDGYDLTGDFMRRVVVR